MTKQNLFASTSDSAFNYGVNSAEVENTEVKNTEVDKSKEVENTEVKNTEVDKPKESDKSKETTISDEEAKLLKEVMKYKEERNNARKEINTLKEQIKPFEGLNAEEIKKLLEEQKTRETKALEDKGEYQRIIEQSNKEWQDKFDALQNELNSEKEKNKETHLKVLQKEKANKFANSNFVRDELIVSGSKIEQLYGSYFDYNEDGELVGYDKPRGMSDRTPIVDTAGKNADFEYSLTKIIKNDADAKPLFRNKVKGGAGSKTDDVEAKEKRGELTRDEKFTEGLKTMFPDLDLAVFKQ